MAQFTFHFIGGGSWTKEDPALDALEAEQWVKGFFQPAPKDDGTIWLSSNEEEGGVIMRRDAISHVVVATDTPHAPSGQVW